MRGNAVDRHPPPAREPQDLERLLDKLAPRWAAGQTVWRIGAALVLSPGAARAANAAVTDRPGLA